MCAKENEKRSWAKGNWNENENENLYKHLLFVNMKIYK